MRRREPRYDVPKKAPDGPLRLVQEFLNTGDREHGREWLDSPEALKGWLMERDARAPLRSRHPRRSREVARDQGGATGARPHARRLPASQAATALLDDVAGAAQLTMRFDPGGAAWLEPAASGRPARSVDSSPMFSQRRSTAAGSG